MTQQVDVFIVGAGPAGTTAAALLAEQGMSVCVAERETFPRFRIGESLLPGGNEILQRLGVWEKMDQAGFMRKYGAEFVSVDGESRVHNVFADGLIAGLDHTYQVERSRFDALMLANAQQKGAKLIQPAKVTAAKSHTSGWRVQYESNGKSESITARWVLDASGRTAFLGKRLKLAQDTIPYPKRFAVYNHFVGVQRRSGKEAGNIIITRLRDGWFWAIPLDECKTSVGVVATRNRDEWLRPEFTPKVFFDRELESSKFLSELMANAQPCDDYRVTADYTYSFSDYAGPNYLLLGDAAGFIDPIFSSGVYLALRSASMAADAIIMAHREQRPLSSMEQRRYTKSLKKNVRTMRDLIEVYYDPKTYAVFMSPTKRLSLFPSVNSIVAGNSNPSFGVRWRFQLFLLICRINRLIPLVPAQKIA